jgi:transmembrane sensor
MAVQINDIDARAAEWAAKLDAGEVSGDERAAFDAWLAADTRHVGAFTKALAVLAQVDRVRAAGTSVEALRQRASFAPSRRHIVVGASIAASLAAIAVVGDFAWDRFNVDSYETRIGETAVVPLSDGSIVTLNTDSKVLVRYSQAKREITLVRGEALFDVAKNKQRPFVVVARDMHVRAVGTSFSVRMLANRPLEVLVREGVVEVKRPSVPVAAPVLVQANMRAVAPIDAPIVITRETPAKVERDLAWRMGRLAFDDEMLASASQEFARYSTTRIVIDDPAVARRTVTGLFVSNDPVGFARAVAISLDLRAEVRQNEVRLMRRSQ